MAEFALDLARRSNQVGQRLVLSDQIECVAHQFLGFVFVAYGANSANADGSPVYAEELSLARGSPFGLSR